MHAITAPFARLSAVALAVAGIAGLNGCSDDSSSGSSPTAPGSSPTVLTGVVATGRPLAGASVSVIDSDAATADPAPVTAGADGSYSIDVSGLKAPFLVQATALVEGVTTRTVAVVPTVTANASNTANVTPLTNAVAALVAPGGDPQALVAPATLSASATPQKVSDASALVVSTLSTDPVIKAALPAGFDPLKTAFTANGTGIDAVLDQLAVDVSGAGVSITNLAAPVAGGAVQTPVTLTSTTTVAPTLPASATAGALPTAAEIAALGAKYEACLALPVAQRVTLDSVGNVTAVSAKCNYAPSDWKSNGRTWAQEVGQLTFAKDLLSGAKVGKGAVTLTLMPDNFTDPKVFKQPYCNTATCVVVRYPLTTASGQSTASDWLIAKVGTAWDFIGNQRPYRTFPEARLNRKVASNTAAASGAYNFKNRYESILRLLFDLNSPGTANIRAVRFTGPGLPAAGVVLFRSQVCGTDDRMAITYQNGSTRLNSNTTQFQFWTGNSGVDFILDAANLDGTPLAMPTPVLNTTTASFQNYSPTPVANQSTLIPAWSRYMIEVFRFTPLSDTPDEIIYARVDTPAENAARGATKQWPTLAQKFIDGYLNPTGSGAGTISSLAQTMSWTTPSQSYVGSSYLFSSNFATATNSEAETASYGLRTRLDFEPLVLGDLTDTGRAFASVVAGTSLSPSTSSVSTNPNPRCTSTSLVPLTTNSNDYREAGLAFRGSDRKLYNAIWFWDN